MAPQTDVASSRPVKQAVSRKKKSTKIAETDNAGTKEVQDSVESLLPAEKSQTLAIDKSIFLRKFTENALQQMKEGNTDEYYKLIKVFSYARTASHLTPEKYVEEVTPWISAVSANVSALSLAYRELVTTIFYSDWITSPDERFVHRYSTLIIQILSAHPTWVPQAMPALVRWFAFGSHKKENTDLAPIVHDRMHGLIKEIYRTIPTCGASLISALLEALPFRTAKANIQVLFLQNVLKCLEYAGGIRREVLRMVLNHVIQIDVEVQVELEDLESDDEDEEEGEAATGVVNFEEEGVFQFDEDEDTGGKQTENKGDEEVVSDITDSDSESGSDSDSDSGSDSDSEAGSEISDQDAAVLNAKAKLRVKKTVAKLDAIMSTVFAWLEKHCQIDPETNEMPESTSQMFLQLLDLFNTVVLPTFMSRYTQFFLFYLCAKDAQYSDVFLGTMMGNVGDPVRTNVQERVSNVEKLAAASYLGSFVARAKFLSKQIVRNVMGVMVQWANTYIDWQEQQAKVPSKEGLGNRIRSMSYGQAFGGPGTGSGSGSSQSLSADFEKHTVFYAVTQAALYMFCFRWRDLVETVDNGPVIESELDDLRWCQEVEGVQRIVFSKLNPLRACSSAVAQQFAMVASQTKFMFCYSVLQQNRRKNHEGDNSGAGSVVASPEQVLRAELDTFFPFDPMALPVSRNFIDNIYLEWQDVGSSNNDDAVSDGSDGEDSDRENKNDEDDDENEAGVVGQMLAMSISPIVPLSALAGRTFDEQF
ncbi:DNA independent RNA polymerase I transcription factor [Coemansia sp. IMI 203386]|nr:DNA independent RNA polymerase I transcription factor [Coemansia sp. IMI 203386]